MAKGTSKANRARVDGKAGSGASAQVTKTINRISEPKTNQDFIDKLKVMVEASNAKQDVSEYRLYTSEWQNYGKSRTYYKVYESRSGKQRGEHDYGYYDNNANKYVPPKAKGNSLDSQHIYTISGSKLDDAEISDATRSLIKKKNDSK